MRARERKEDPICATRKLGLRKMPERYSQFLFPLHTFMPPAINNDLDPLHVPIILQKEPDFVCQYENCAKSFKRKAKLIEHERVHTGEVGILEVATAWAR